MTTGIEAGESPKDAAIRGLKEELNLDSIKVTRFGAYGIPRATHLVVV